MPKPVRRTILPPPPSAGTLKRYGLTATDWADLCRRQGCVCPVCEQPFGDRRLVVDHAHVKGFKATRRPLAGKTRRRRVMSAGERKTHVRGVLHAWCNGYVRAWLTLDRARSLVAYLEAHAARAGA